MSVLLGTLAINEIEHLPALYEQHRSWPELAAWIFVEASDRVYAEANPDLVTADGLSVDGTSEFLRSLAACDPRVVYIPHGFSTHPDPARGKAAARQRYLDVANAIRPEFVVVVDADEFYPHDAQHRILDIMRRAEGFTSYVFRHREVWRPPSIADQPLFQYEVTGGFWSVACCHWFRWVPGMNHRDCHNMPSDARGTPLNEKSARLEWEDGYPEMIHLGFASAARTRLAKSRYYARRGEDTDQRRAWYVESRAAWEAWRPGDVLPYDAQVVPYGGVVPEVFR